MFADFSNTFADFDKSTFADFSNTFADFDKSTSFIPIRFIKLIQIFIKDRIKTILMF